MAEAVHRQQLRLLEQLLLLQHWLHTSSSFMSSGFQLLFSACVLCSCGQQCGVLRVCCQVQVYVHNIF